MDTLILILMALCLLLSYLLWVRRRNEISLAKSLFSLSEKQKNYLTIILEKRRLEVSEQAESDKEALSSLYETGWIWRFNDGVYVADSKLEYLHSRLSS